MDLPQNIEDRLLAAQHDVEGDEIKNTTGKAMIELLTTLNNYLETEKGHGQKIVGDYLAHQGAANLLQTYLNIYIKKLSRKKSRKRFNMSYLETLLYIVMMYTDPSKAFSEAVASCAMLETLINFLEKYEATFKQNATHEHIVVCSLAILHNCSVSSNNKKYYKGKATEVIERYAKKHKDVENTACAMLTLAHIAEDNDNNIVPKCGIISFLIETMTKALENENHRSPDGFTAKEVALGLTKLANNDTNSKEILAGGALPKLMELIKEGDLKEKTTAVKCIFALSFVEENKRKIEQDEKVISTLEDLTRDKIRKLQAVALGALYKLGSMDRPKKEDSTKRQKHVMLSYSWSHKITIWKVCEKIASHDYNTWIDKHHMKGNILDAMAEAVENSAVVLICMSQKYKDSPNCRLEAEYASSKGKPLIPLKMEKGYEPDGWLGILIGRKLYFNFTDKANFTDEVSKLIREIGERGKKEIKDVKEKTYQQRNRENEQTLQPNPVQPITFQDVAEWAKNHGLRPSQFKNVDGETLQFLSSSKLEAPEFFYRHIKEELGIKTSRELMLFTKALKHCSI